MKSPQDPLWSAVSVTTPRRLSLVIKALIADMLCMTDQVMAAPDLTDGELPVNACVWINLRPTGVQAGVTLMKLAFGPHFVSVFHRPRAGGGSFSAGGP